MGNAKNLVGMKFGRWLVIKRGENGVHGKVRWQCICECGVKRVVSGDNLTSGKSLSCGCLHRELTRKKFLKHGHAGIGKKTKEYTVWQNMRQRCDNPNRKDYKNYGGRGITVCERWNDFKNFLEDMGERPSGLEIDRIDNNGNYELGNCRWANRKEQMSNMADRKISKLKVQVIKKLLAESSLKQKDIAEIFNISKVYVSEIKLNKKRKNVQYKPV